MHRGRTFSRRPAHAFAVACAMALLLLLQGAAVGMLRAAGPAHRHATADATLVLDDVRRGPAIPIATLQPHGHDHAGVARHHHARSDASVVRVDGEWRVAEGGGDGDGAGSVGTASMAFLALPSSGLAVTRAVARTALRPAAGWSLQTHVPDHPERPPRAG